MSTKRKKALPKTKTCQNKTDHFIPFAKYLTTPLIPMQKEEPKEDTNYNQRVNPDIYEAFGALSSDIERNRINSSRDLCIFLVFAEVDLYFSKFANILILFILNNIYERNFLNLIVFFDEFALFNLLFPLSLNDTLINALNTTKTREERGERREERGERREERGEYFFYWETSGDSAKLPFQSRNWPF